MRKTTSRRALPVPLAVRDAARAKLLLDPEARRVLGPFMAGESSVTDAASALGVKPNTLLKRVKALERLGLLRVARVEERAGRAIKRYASVAESFFVPFEATDLHTLEALLLAATDEPNRLIALGMAHALESHGPGLGYIVSGHEGGGLRHDLSLDGRTEFDPVSSEGVAFARAWGSLRLDFAAAKRFQAELLELLERYSGGQGAAYFALVAFTPLPPDA
jgi:DNA-binding transcriptional ArsR family regulator